MLEIEKINQYDELVALENKWNPLLNKSEINTIFLTHEWIKNWWRHFGQDKDLFVLIVKNNNHIIGIAPLMVTHSRVLGIKKRKVQFIGTPLSDYCDFIIGKEKEAVLKAIYGYLIKNRKEWSNISLEEIPEHSSSLSLSKNILKSMTNYFDIFFTNKCLSLDFKEMNHKSLKKKLKKRDISKKIDYLKEKGDFSFYHINDLNEAHESLNTLFEQHIKRWDKKGNPSMFKENKYKEFFINLTNDLLPKDKIGICVLKFNQKPISIQFGFNHNNKYLAYCASHDLDYSKQSPGMVLIKLMLYHYFQEKYEEVDFSRGAEPYKYRFINKTVNNFGLTIHKNTINHMFSKFYNKTKERIIKNKKLHSFVIKYKNKVAHSLSISSK